MAQEGKTRNFKTLFKSRQKALANISMTNQNNNEQNKKEMNDNYDITQPKIRSLTPIARRIQMKPQQLNNNNNTSMNMNLNMNDEGVCTNCINSLIANQHHPPHYYHLKDRNLQSLNNLFDLQDQQNKYQKERINTSINKRMNLAEKVANSLPKTNEKERFINFVEAEQFTLNECTPNIPQRQALEKYNLKEEVFNKNTQKLRFENRKVIDYYERVATTNQNQAIIVNKSNQYKNPYLPSIKQYNSILNEQIQSKKTAKQNEKEIDHALERQAYEINKQKHEQEVKERMESIQRLRCDFVSNNSNLISLKQKRNKFDRLNDISNEVKQSEEIKEESKKIRDKALEYKMAQRKQLQLSLDSHIEMKRSISRQEREKKCSRNDTEDVNIYREPLKKEEMSYCDECHKSYAKRYIFPKAEYKHLFTQQK